jgi:hypothetical protein
MTFKYSEELTASLEPLLLELDHEATVRNSAVLVGMHHAWTAHEHTTRSSDDASAVNDLDTLPG